MTATEYLLDVLGGPKPVRGRTDRSKVDLRDRVRTGLPYDALESVRARLHLSLPETAAILNVPLRTLARRRQGGKLDAHESDRLYRLVRIMGHAFVVFGSEEKAAIWLRRPNRALNGEAPLLVLDTDLGARQVDDILGRIEYGVVS